MRYRESWKIYNDYFNTLESAERKSIAEGERKNNLEHAKRMKDKGFSIDDIVDITGLSIEEIDRL